MGEHLLLGVFLSCLLGGVVPLVNVEAVVLGAAILLEPSELPLLVGTVTAGQMTAKTALYGVARWAPSRLPERARKALTRTRALSGTLPAGMGALLVSSAFGVPPFYVATLAAGALRFPVGAYLVSGVVGNVIRYGLLVGAVGTARGG